MVCDAHNDMTEKTKYLLTRVDSTHKIVTDMSASFDTFKVTTATKHEALNTSMINGFLLVNENIRKMEIKYAKTKWRPGHVVALASSFFGASSAIVVALIMTGVIK